MRAYFSAIMLIVIITMGSTFPCRATEMLEPVELQITPATVEIGPLYHGAEVVARAVVPLGLDVVLVCIGPDETLELKRKGKVWGILWMNVGELVFERVPSLYILLSSGHLADIASEETLSRNRLGYDALSRHVSGNETDAEELFLFKEMIKLKERDRLFHIGEGEVVVKQDREGFEKIEGRFRLPPKAAPATYTVSLFGLREGKVVVRSEESLALARVGSTAFISSVAKNHGLAYGCGAVLIALGTGLLTGWVFGLRTKRHR